MKRYTILMAFILGYLLANGQVFTQEVMAAASDFNENQGYSLSWTMGETVTETFIKGDDQFTQGFQQTYIYEITWLPRQVLADQYNIEVYPNPAGSFFFVKIDTDQEREPIKMILYNMLGVRVDETTLEPELHTKKINIDLFSSDMFHLIITDDENRFIQRFKIVKVNK